MINKLWHVLKTYLYRKLFWFAALLYVVFTLVDWNMPIRETPRLWMESQTVWAPAKSFDGVSAFMQWTAGDQELESLNRLTIDGTYVVASNRIGDDGQPMRELKQDWDTSSEFVEKLAKCLHLRELILHSFPMTSELGEAIARLPNLHRLELSLNGSPIPSMANLPALNQLRSFQVPHVPMSELGLLAKHRQLKTIELQDWPTTTADNTAAVWNEPCTLHQATQIEEVVLKPINRMTWGMMHHRLPPMAPASPMSPEESNEAVPFHQSLIDNLAQLPNLKAVEVRDPWGGWPARTTESPQVTEALAGRPEVSLNPIVRSAESFSNPFGYFATFLVIAVILIQLFDHFGSGMARTAPGFSVPHLSIAGGLLSLQVLIAAGVLVVRQQLAWLPAMAIYASLPTVVAIAVGWVTRHPRSLPLMFAFGIWAALGLVYASRPLFNWLGGDEFLHANNAKMIASSLMLLAMEFATIVWATKGLQRLPVQLEEAHLPAGLGVMQTIKQLQLQKMNQTHHSRVKRSPAWRLLDQKLAAFTQAPPQLDKLGYRRWQWHAANLSNWKSTLIASALAPWALVGIFCVTFGVLSGQYSSFHSYTYYSVVAGTFCWVMYAVIASSLQMMRRPVLEQELLRPIWRSEFNQRLLEAPWMMSWPAIFVSVLYLIAFLMYSRFQLPEDGLSQSIAQLMVPHGLLVLTWPLPILVSGTLLITIVSEFWRGIVAFSIQFSLFLILQFILIGRLFNKSTASPWTSTAIDIVAIVCFLLALLIYWRVRKRLAGMQWGWGQS